MVTKFRDLPNNDYSGRVSPFPKARLDVINPMIEKQKAKGLIPMTTKSEEIMWVHPDIVKDEQ